MPRCIEDEVDGFRRKEHIRCRVVAAVWTGSEGGSRWYLFVCLGAWGSKPIAYILRRAKCDSLLFECYYSQY